MSLVVLRYHEITLKGGNRTRFAGMLIENVRRLLAGLGVTRIADVHGRVVATLADDAAWPEVRARLGRVYGIANYSLARSLPFAAISEPDVDLRPLADGVLASLAGIRFGSFRVVTKRSEKRFPRSSPQVSAEIGAAVASATGARVDLDAAELTITIEILPKEVLYSVEKVAGPGGLPVGTAGHVLALLSGGIDSPVAAARMMRRGCRVSFVHFHSVPYLDRSSQRKARDLVRTLAAHQGDARLVLVPIGEAQRQIVVNVPPPPRVLLYRRLMVRLAGEIAAAVGAEALVTGDSLAQVASQTLPNLAVVEQAATLPLLRPLIGMDKAEVSEQARRLGTFEISIEPDQDCCSLFTPRHPTTRARPWVIESAERAVDLAALSEEALAGAVMERYRYPDSKPEPEIETLVRRRSSADPPAPSTPGPTR